MIKSVADWRAVARLGLMVAACVLTGAASAKPTVNPAISQGLRFFTIAERVAALRAAGQLPPASPEVVVPKPAAVAFVLETPAPVAPAAAVPDLLGMTVLPLPGGEFTAKWRGMAGRWQVEQVVLDACRVETCADGGAPRWLEIAAAAGKRSGAEQLSYVHASINRSIAYATDYASGGTADHWASPLESLGGLGDCEDYAIAKYMMLRSLGYGAQDLKLVVLYQPWAGLHHAILAVRGGDGWVYLDNQRVGLSSESDYRGVHALAALDENGEALLAALPKMAEAAPAAGVPMLRGPR